MTAPRSAYTASQRVRVVAVAAGVPLLLAVVGAILVFSWRAGLPTRIATQWGGGGPSTFTPLAGVIALILGVAAVLVAVFLFATLSLTDQSSPVRGRFYAAAGAWVSTTITFGVVGSVAIQRDGGDSDGGTVGRILMLGVVVSLLPAVLVWLLTPRSTRVEPSDDPAPEAIELSPEERAVFSRRIAPGRRLLVAVGSLLGLVCVFCAVPAVAEPAGWLAVGVIVIVAAAVFACLLWRVTVTRSGFVARAVLGVPRFRVPIADIASARVSRVDPLAQFGGWGVRWGAAGVGIVLAAGEALEITRVDGRRLTVTTPDAATAAALVNSFVARAHRE